MGKGIQNIQICFTEKDLTHYGGLYLIHKFCKICKIKWLLQRHIKFHLRNQEYQTAEFILILIYMIIAGIGRIENVKNLGYNGVIKKILGIKKFPNPTSIRRFLYRLTPDAIRQIVKVHNIIQGKIFCILHKKTSMTLDIDGTVMTVYGKQQRTKVGFNPKRRGARSYLGMLCFEGDREFWYGSLRPGNISQVKVAPHIIEECLKKLPYPIYRIRIRGDSIFYSHRFIEDYLEKENIYYSIEASITGPIREKLEQIKYSPYKGDWEVGEFYYQPTAHGHIKWIKPHRFVVQRRPLPEDSEERSQLKLFEMKNYGYRVIITNLKLKNRHIWNFHSKRSQGAEQNIKELKLNYPLAKIPTHKYTANISYFQILLFAFNIVNWFKWICLPEEYHYKTLQTLREQLLCIQARLTKTDNRNMLRFPAGYLYKDLYAEAIKNINKIKQI